MERFKVVFFDILLILGAILILTGASVFFPPELAGYFHKYPKYHRLFLSVITFLFFSLFATDHFYGALDRHSKIVSWLKNLRVDPIYWVWFIFLIVGAVFSYSSFIRHHVFNSSFDFAIFAQAIWNTWHGNFLYSSIKGGICLLGDHVSPILALLAPFCRIWDDPTIFLILQAIVAVSSVFPIYFIAQKVFNEERIPLIFVIAYVLYLPLRNAVRFDFHPELLGDPLILWAFYFILCRRLCIASVFLVFTLMTKETACAPIAILGLYCWWFEKEFLFGVVWFLIAICVFFVDVKIIAPFFFGGEYFYLRGNYSFTNRAGIAMVVHQLFSSGSLTYLKKIFLPVGFFPFLRPSALLLTVPILFQNLVARNMMTRSIFFHYTSFLTPFVFVSAIYGFRNFLKWAKEQARWKFRSVKLLGIYWLLGCSLIMAGVSEYCVIRQYRSQDNDHLNYIRQYLKKIPSRFSVRTHEVFAPHLFNRKELYIFENQNPKEGASAKALMADYVIIDKGFLAGKFEDELNPLLQHGYVVEHEHEGFYVLKNSKF